MSRRSPSKTELRIIRPDGTEITVKSPHLLTVLSSGSYTLIRAAQPKPKGYWIRWLMWRTVAVFTAGFLATLIVRVVFASTIGQILFLP